MDKWHGSIQKAAQSAFSSEDWEVLMREPGARAAFRKLHSTLDVEEFIYDGYDRLRLFREDRCGSAAEAGFPQADRSC